MEITKEQFQTLKQLDRIEFLLERERERIEKKYSSSYLSAAVNLLFLFVFTGFFEVKPKQEKIINNDKKKSRNKRE